MINKELLSKYRTEIFKMLMSVGTSFDLSAEEFLERELTSVDENNEDEKIKYLMEMIPKWYLSLNDLPVWIQDDEWCYDEKNMPMIFIGQFNIETIKINLHDDCSFYLFYSKYTGEKNVVHQIS